MFFVAIALVALAMGAVLAVFPGPAIPFFFIAGGLLAAESRPIARFMDWAEVHIRQVVAWGKRRWKRLSTPGRILAVMIFAGGSATMAFLSYRLLSGNG